jgi:hypothetical protein
MLIRMSLKEFDQKNYFKVTFVAARNILLHLILDVNHINFENQ